MWLIVWLVILILMIIIEVFSMEFVCLWMACGAAVSAILAAVSLPVWAQWAAFAVVSFILFATLRPKLKNYFRKNRRENSLMQLIGMRGLVISEIDNLRGIGQVRIGGRDYAAESRERNVVVPENTVIVVVGVRAHRLVTKLDDSMIDNIELEESDVTLDPHFIEQEDR